MTDTFPDCGWCSYFENRTGKVRSESSALVCRFHKRMLPYLPNGHSYMLCSEFRNFKTDETAKSWGNSALVDGVLFSYGSPYQFKLEVVQKIQMLPEADAD